MYMSTLLSGEADAGAPEIMACACMICQGKSWKVSDRAFDLPSTIASSVPSTIKVVSDSRVTGTIAPGEAFDSIALDVVAGQTYSVALRGAGADPLVDPLLGLYDQNGVRLNEDDDGGAGITSLLTFTATTTGTYTVRAQGYETGDTGGYAVDVWQRTVDSVPDLRPRGFFDEPPEPGAYDAAVEINVGTSFGHYETADDFVDTYKILLEAGKVYTFEVAGGADYRTSRDAVPLGELNTILIVFGADGEVRASNDDISASDLSAGTVFAPTETGYYYLATGSYEGLGGYTIDVTEIDPTQIDPLDSIDWFDADLIPTVEVNGQPTAYVYFGDSDENFDQTGDDGEPMVTIDWNAFEKGQVMLALEEFERILGIDYQITTDVSQATFRLLKTESDNYGAYFYPQDPGYGDQQGVGVFNVLSGAWSFDQQQSLLKGGYAFAVVLHEFGHAHGLAHPHDNGGSSDIMLGVTGPNSLGLFDLNQGVYSVMSYNDAWETGPNGPTPFSRSNIDSGWSGTLSAFDIAVLQRNYGVTDRNTGNDVYQLGDANDPGVFYRTIWDSAGTDEIRYDGARDAQIDLTAATLDYTPTGGGVVSFVDEIWGGYTIAGGVVVENATGGTGNDALLGNGAANVLTGNAGADMLMGRGGSDSLVGGDGADTLVGGAGDDRLRGGNGVDRFVFAEGGGVDTILDFRRGDKIDLTAFVGVDRSDVVVSAGRIVVENGAEDITILYQGDRVSASAFLFAGEAPPATSMSTASAPVDVSVPLSGPLMLLFNGYEMML